MRYHDRNVGMIKGLHEAVQHKMWQALDELELIGEDILITDGFRTMEEQTLIYAQGRTLPGPVVSNSPAGWSYHNYGLAVDIVPIGPLGVELSARFKLEWMALSRYQNIGRVLQAVGFEWGFQLWGVDYPHFQYAPGLTIQKIRAGERPDTAIARDERKEALKQTIDIASKAFLSKNVVSKRKNELYTYIMKKEAQLAAIH